MAKAPKFLGEGFEASKLGFRTIKSKDDICKLHIGKNGRLTIPAIVLVESKLEGFEYFSIFENKSTSELALVFFKESSKEYACRRLSFFKSKSKANGTIKNVTAYTEIGFSIKNCLKVSTLECLGEKGQMVDFETKENAIILKLANLTKLTKTNFDT